MADQAKRSEKRAVMCREGGKLAVALDGPPGEALHVAIGIEDPADGDLVVRKLTPDVADSIAKQLTEYAAVVRERR